MPLQWRHNERNGISNHQPLTIVYSTVYSGADQRNHQNSVSLAFVQGIPKWRMNSPHKWPETREMFSLDDVIMRDQYMCQVVGVKAPPGEWTRLFEGLDQLPIWRLLHSRGWGHLPWWQGLWGQHGVHPGPTGPRWAPCWPHELCYLGNITSENKQNHMVPLPTTRISQ